MQPQLCQWQKCNSSKLKIKKSIDEIKRLIINKNEYNFASIWTGILIFIERGCHNICSKKYFLIYKIYFFH